MEELGFEPKKGLVGLLCRLIVLQAGTLLTFVVGGIMVPRDAWIIITQISGVERDFAGMIRLRA